MTGRCSRWWCRWFVVLAVVAGQSAVLSAQALEDDRALLVEWLTGELVAREDSSYMDKYVGEEMVVDGLGEPAIWVDEAYDGVGYELYGDTIKDWLKIRQFGSKVSEDLPRRMLEDVGLSLNSLRTFSIEYGSGSILMRTWSPTFEGRRSLAGRRKPNETRRIDVTNLVEIEGCATRFKRRGAEFVGVPVGDTCAMATRDGAVNIERRWRVRSEGFEMDVVLLSAISQSSNKVRLSALYRSEYFELRLVDLSQRALGSTSGVVKRIHDQNGSVTFGPATRDGKTIPDAFGTGGPRLDVKLDRASNNRVMTGTRRWDDGSTEQAFEVRIPIDTDEFQIGVANALLEMRTVRPRSSDLDEVAGLLPGSFSNRAQTNGIRHREVVMHVAPIWTERTDFRWLYVEMAIAAAPDEPILQRVIEMGPGRDPWTVRWFVHKLDDPENLVGLWRHPDSFDYGTNRSRLAPSPCERVFEKRGGAWVSTSNRLCAPDPVETFTWLLTPNQIQLEQFAHPSSGELKVPGQLVKLDRLESAR